MNYLIQGHKKKSSELRKKFDEKSSLTLEKHKLYLAVVRDTRVVVVPSSNQKALQDICQSSNVVNRISSDVIPYKAEDY